MRPEAEIIADLASGLEALLASLADTIDLTGSVPVDYAAFDARDKVQRVASTSLLKVIEQVEDQLAQLFRTILRALAVDTSGCTHATSPTAWKGWAS